jgi:hypothetical protein
MPMYCEQRIEYIEFGRQNLKDFELHVKGSFIIAELY